MTNEIRTDFYKNVRNEIENRIESMDADAIPSYLESLTDSDSKGFEEVRASLNEEYDYYFLEEELEDIVFNIVNDLEMNWQIYEKNFHRNNNCRINNIICKK